MEKTTKKVSFEKSMQKLEGILEKLEQGDLPLEKSLKLYQEGMALSAQCAQQLEEAQQSVKLIQIQGQGMAKESDFPALEEEEV